MYEYSYFVLPSVIFGESIQVPNFFFVLFVLLLGYGIATRPCARKPVFKAH